jgi:GntR family transcriptional repressor for pyruvate dehydrogenase complex
LSRLNSAKLVEQTVAALREQILSGSYPSGAVLPSQGAICDELGVSRSVVREAMRTLQSQGLIEVTQGRRPCVLPAGPAPVIESLGTLVERSVISLQQLLEVRRPLEVEIAARAARQRSDEHVEQLRLSLDAMRDAGDLPAQVDADVHFHKILADASGNPLFGIMLDVLSKLLHESRRHTIRQSGIETALRFHERIFRAVQEWDVESARNAMREHMEQTALDLDRRNA